MKHTHGRFHSLLIVCLCLFTAFFQGCSTLQTVNTDTAFRMHSRDIFVLHQDDKTWISTNAKFSEQTQLAGKFDLLEKPMKTGAESREMHLYVKDGQEPLPNQFSEQTPITKDSIKKAKVYSLDVFSVLIPVAIGIILFPIVAVAIAWTAPL